MVLGMLCSVCCLCEERGKVISGMDTFVQDYDAFSRKMHLGISKLLIFIDNDWFSKGEGKTKFDTRVNDNEQLMQRVVRERKTPDTSWVQTLISSLTRAQFHETFISSHSHLFGEPYIKGFLHWSNVLVEMINLNLTFDKYVEALPNPADPEAASHISAISRKVAIAKEIYENGRALEFTSRIKVDRGTAIALHSNILEHIQKTFTHADSAVVMVVMGAPGLGKSTLLNHIVQYLTESPQLSTVFKTGNSAGHTTIGSQVLSSPLVYKDHQIMLVDLEGLGGTELINPEEAILQANLVSALLTVASVPYLMVSNSTQSLRFVDTCVAQIAQLQMDFGFLTERIYLLFHDKNMPENEDGNSEHGNGNEQFKARVEELNCRHFRGRQVIMILNKPNFTAEDGVKQRSKFLEMLLENSLFIKKNASGTKVQIQDLLSIVSLIASNETEDLSGIHLSKADLDRKAEFIVSKKNQINSIKQGVQSLDDRYLLTYFKEDIRVKFTDKTNSDLSVMEPPGLKKHCEKVIQLELARAGAEMTELETCYTPIREAPIEEMKTHIEELMKYLYKSSWTLVHFLPKVKALKEKLELVRSHFPESNDKITSLLAAIESCRNWDIFQSSAIYAVQLALTVGTFGVGAALGAAFSAARGGAAVAQGAMFSTRAVGAALGMGVGVGGNITGGLVSASIAIQKSSELIFVNSWWGNLELNPNALSISNSERKSTDPPTLVPVLLFIGSKTTKVAEFANSYIQHIAPLTPVDFEAFSPNKYTQILSFDYTHSDQSSKTPNGYLICLRMKKKATSKYSRIMQKIAEQLTPVATVACLLVDYPTHYAQPLIDILYPRPTPSQSQSVETKIPTKVLLIHRHGADTGEMRGAMHRCDCNYKSMPIDDFRQDKRATMSEIKKELDRERATPLEEFEKVVRALPQALAELQP